EDHLQDGPGAAPREQPAVEPGGVERVDLPAGDALDPLLDADALGARSPVHLGEHADRANVGGRGRAGGDLFGLEVAPAFEIRGDSVGVAAFGDELELVAHGPGEAPHHPLRVEGAQFRAFRLDDLGDPRHQAQVGLDDRTNAGSAHLQDYVVAVVGPGAI